MSRPACPFRSSQAEVGPARLLDQDHTARRARPPPTASHLTEPSPCSCTPFVCHRVDKEAAGSRVWAALKGKTGQATVPYVFVGGELIGASAAPRRACDHAHSPSSRFAPSCSPEAPPRPAAHLCSPLCAGGCDACKALDAQGLLAPKVYASAAAHGLGGAAGDRSTGDGSDAQPRPLSPGAASQASSGAGKGAAAAADALTKSAASHAAHGPYMRE